MAVQIGELTITREDGSFIVLDVVESASFQNTVILPRHPVDPGAGPGTLRTVNDSAVKEPLDFTVQVRVSALAPVGAIADPRREEAAADFLESIVGEYVTVQLPRRRPITDCQLAAWPTELTRSLSTPFSLTFSRTGFAGRTTTLLPRIVSRAKPDLPPDEDIGEQPTRVVPAEKAAPVQKSMLKRAGKYIGENLPSGS